MSNNKKDTFPPFSWFRDNLTLPEMRKNSTIYNNSSYFHRGKLAFVFTILRYIKQQLRRVTHILGLFTFYPHFLPSSAFFTKYVDKYKLLGVTFDYFTIVTNFVYSLSSGTKLARCQTAKKRTTNFSHLPGLTTHLSKWTSWFWMGVSRARYTQFQPAGRGNNELKCIQQHRAPLILSGSELIHNQYNIEHFIYSVFKCTDDGKCRFPSRYTYTSLL